MYDGVWEGVMIFLSKGCMKEVNASKEIQLSKVLDIVSMPHFNAYKIW